MTPAVYQFSQAISTARRAGEGDIRFSDIRRVVATWEREYSSGAWEGGYLLELSDRAYVYLVAWTGEEGWGVDDGAQVLVYGDQPDWRNVAFFGVSKYLAARMNAPTWNTETTELNQYVAEQSVVVSVPGLRASEGKRRRIGQTDLFGG